ncbi:lamin tail domain-containing protein [Candidatus Saccharibacteria bacterium]|nr:lamin tail domain-containing protein [Candidatus Saccharibacteria bacterium]
MKKICRSIKYLATVIMCVGMAVPVGAITEVPEVGPALDLSPKLMILAVNAGYTGVDGSQQNYDFVELFNVAGEPLRLEGYSLVYTNSGGNSSVHSWSAGVVLNAEFLAVGYNGSPQFAEAEEDYRYRFNLAATTGTVSLLYDGEIVDEVCWGSAGCSEKYGQFSTSQAGNLTLARCIVDGLADDCGNGRAFEFRAYYPEINFGALVYDVPEEEPAEELPTDLASCKGLIFSEIFTYFEVDYGEQFVELFNPTDEIISVGDCRIKYKNQTYAMVGELQPGEYLAYQNAELKLTKNPTASNEVLLIDSDGTEVASLTYYGGQKKSVSYAWFGIAADGGEIWRQTYAVTPGEENVYQEFKSCPAGKVINPLTGNCINFFEDEPLPDCPAGKFRNPETNRCKSYETVAGILAPCAEGYFRNPETNRCKKIATATAALTPCKDGYERNPETNRCRQIRENNGAEYGVEPTTYTDTSTFVAYGTLAVVVVGGILYVVLQFRHEIGRFCGQRLRKHAKMKP